MSAERFYAVRQARTKVIGSRNMSRGEAEREVAAWLEHIGPAVMVPDSPAVRRAVHTGNQEALGALLAGTS